MLSILLYVWLVCFSGVACMAEDEVRLGNEAEDFFDIAKRRKKTVILATQTITLSLFAYLPVCQFVAQVIFCDKESYLMRQNGGNCDSSFLKGMSISLITLYVIPLRPSSDPPHIFPSTRPLLFEQSQSGQTSSSSLPPSLATQPNRSNISSLAGLGEH